MNTAVPIEITLDTAGFSFQPVTLQAVLPYLLMPVGSEPDSCTLAEIDKLNSQRNAYLCLWARAICLKIKRRDPRQISLENGLVLNPSPLFIRLLNEINADSLIVAGFSIDGGVDTGVRQFFKEEKVFEAFVLKQWAAAMTEQVREWLHAQLSKWANQHSANLTDYDGPGYNGWPLSELQLLHSILEKAAPYGQQTPIQVNESQALSPANSMLLVYGLFEKNLTPALLAGN